jgi:hypothetical protein
MAGGALFVRWSVGAGLPAADVVELGPTEAGVLGEFLVRDALREVLADQVVALLLGRLSLGDFCDRLNQVRAVRGDSAFSLP